MATVMTDHQFDAILDMVDLILEGCQSVSEAQEKIRKIKKNQEKNVNEELQDD